MVVRPSEIVAVAFGHRSSAMFVVSTLDADTKATAGPFVVHLYRSFFIPFFLLLPLLLVLLFNLFFLVITMIIAQLTG